MNCIPWLKGKIKKRNTKQGFIKVEPEPVIVFSITDSDDEREDDRDENRDVVDVEKLNHS